MSPRRKAKNQSLPPNTYTYNKGRTTYFRYKHPLTGKFHSLGTVKRDAVHAAHILNSRLLVDPSPETLVAKILQTRDTFQKIATQYRDEVLPTKRSRRGTAMAGTTLSDYQRHIDRAIKAWSGRAITAITRRDVSDLLSQYPEVTRNRTRNTLNGLFKWAMASGYIDTNPVEGTAIATEIVQRARLSHAQFLAIRAQAEPWLQHAMDLGLLTLQRRTDLVNLTADDVHDGGLHVRMKKTGVNLRIRLWPELEALLPKTGPLVTRNHRPVKPDYLSHAFASARDRVPEFSKQSAGEKPSFHEIRALGARLLEEQGKDPQLMLGHLESKTTRVYLDRHKEKWIEA